MPMPAVGRRWHPCAVLALALQAGAQHLAVGRGAGARRANWYMDGGRFQENEQFAQANKASMTGVYLCCNLFKMDKAGTLTSPSLDELADQTNGLRNLGLEIFYVMTIQPETIASASWHQGSETAAHIAEIAKLDGYIVDYEPNSNFTQQHASRYATFLDDFATSLHARGKSLGFDTADWGILNYWGTYKGTGVDVFTSMLYYGKDVPADEAFVQNQINAGVAASRIGVGIGTMLAQGCTPEWDHKWTQESLTGYVDWLAATPGITRLDLWRADIDTYCTTTSWFLDVIAKFLAGGKAVWV